MHFWKISRGQSNANEDKKDKDERQAQGHHPANENGSIKSGDQESCESSQNEDRRVNGATVISAGDDHRRGKATYFHDRPAYQTKT